MQFRSAPTLALCLITWIPCLTPTTLFADSHASGSDLPVKVPDYVTYLPTAVPDRIVLCWADDPATSAAVNWRTDTTVAASIAEIAPARDGPDFAGDALRVSTATQRLNTDLGSALYHSARFEDLTPETTYAYRVGDGTNWSEWVQFQTASTEPKPFSFIYVGDAQNDIKSFWSRVVRGAYRDAPMAAFILHAGDLVNTANSDAEWGQWFYAGGFIHRSTRCIAAPGNHEYKDGLSRHWRPTFTFPENGPPGLEESVYYIDFQGARIISLNSMEGLQEQVGWLEDVLSKNDQRWTILTFHYPIYSAAEGRDNPELRALWQPVFDRFRVDLVLQGHDHAYARTELMASENLASGVTQRSEKAGTVYVVSVSGPKMYTVAKRPFIRRSIQNKQLYQVINVANDELHYEARAATGKLYDAFILRKRDGQVNELVEQLPLNATPIAPIAAPEE